MPKPDFSSLPDRVKSRFRDGLDGNSWVVSGVSVGTSRRDITISKPTYKTFRLAKEADAQGGDEASNRQLVAGMTGLSVDEIDAMLLEDYVDILAVALIPFSAAFPTFEGSVSEGQTAPPGSSPVNSGGPSPS